MNHHSNIPGKFVWFELRGTNIERAQEFYGQLFGWNAFPLPMPNGTYHAFGNEQPIGGFTNGDAGAQWRVYLSVEDVDATVAIAREAGATAEDPHEVPGVGRMAGIDAPDGTSLTVMRAEHGDAPDTAVTQIGEVSWTEAWSIDPAATKAFYNALVGYQAVPFGGNYEMFTLDEAIRAGLLAASPEMGSRWMPYFQVESVSSTTAKAESVGARTLMPPSQMPGVGAFAVFADPDGAVFGVVSREGA